MTASLCVPEASLASSPPPLLGEVKFSELGLTVRLDDTGEVTVRATVVVCVRAPEVPVMVTVELPGAAVLLAESVSTRAVLIDAVTPAPAGTPDAPSATVPVNPFAGVMVIVLVPLDPWPMDKLLGEAARLKSGAAVALTLSVIVVV